MAKTPRSYLAVTFKHINDFLDKYILPWPVRFLTFRLVILLTIVLLIPLVLFANNTVFVLMTNSYLNVMSVAVSSIVLLYSTISEVHQKQIAILQEKRAREDHAHVTEMHQLVLQSVENQRAEIIELRRLLSEMSKQPFIEPTDKPLQSLQKLHPRGKTRFKINEMDDRLRTELNKNAMVTAIHKDFLTDEE